MSRRRPTRAELADHYRHEWLLERADAETEPCPPHPHGCGAPEGVTCTNPYTGLPLDRFPAHPSRIRAAARRPPHPVPPPRPVPPVP